MGVHGAMELSDAFSQMWDATYSSVADDESDARIELDRYHEQGYLKKIDWTWGWWSRHFWAQSAAWLGHSAPYKREHFLQGSTFFRQEEPSRPTSARRSHPPALTNLLRGRAPDPIVAVSQGAHKFGDIRNKDILNTAPTSAKGATTDGTSAGEMMADGPGTHPWEGKENATEMKLVKGTKVEGSSDAEKRPTSMKKGNTPMGIPSQPSTCDPWWSKVMKSSPEEFQVFVEEEFGDIMHEVSSDEDKKTPKLLRPKPKPAASRYRKRGFGRRHISKLAFGTEMGRRGRKDLPKSRKHLPNGSKPCLARWTIARCSRRATECIRSVERDLPTQETPRTPS